MNLYQAATSLTDNAVAQLAFMDWVTAGRRALRTAQGLTETLRDIEHGIASGSLSGGAVPSFTTGGGNAIALAHDLGELTSLQKVALSALAAAPRPPDPADIHKVYRKMVSEAFL